MHERAVLHLAPATVLVIPRLRHLTTVTTDLLTDIRIRITRTLIGVRRCTWDLAEAGVVVGDDPALLTCNLWCLPGLA